MSGDGAAGDDARARPYRLRAGPFDDLADWLHTIAGNSAS
ncbi:hypothetical protein FBZ88_11591 [Nitrospirillum bahiense]|uniref:Uncharacterized protein n=1 Tax=Nitrospirillum amazonense TaxID=28077 RepID=A0A560FMW5_9PROT|nr:hypothetical protein FBZ88_11591 [Nitrospirillum amazonense]